jgi:hypothetical protein
VSGFAAGAVDMRKTCVRFAVTAPAKIVGMPHAPVEAGRLGHVRCMGGGLR